MNKTQAFAEARKVWPQHKPARPQCSHISSDGLAVIVAGYEERTAVVLYHEGDLIRLKSAVDTALKFHNRAKRKRKP